MEAVNQRQTLLFGGLLYMTLRDTGITTKNSLIHNDCSSLFSFFYLFVIIDYFFAKAGKYIVQYM